jgi:hypothetical protein
MYRSSVRGESMAYLAEGTVLHTTNARSEVTGGTAVDTD